MGRSGGPTSRAARPEAPAARRSGLSRPLAAEHLPLEPDSSPHRRGKGFRMPASIRGQRYVALPVAVLLAFVFAVTIASPADASRRSRRIHGALEVARHQKGDPYSYGANGPRRFDCSGLTQFSFRRAGLYLPRTSRAQARYTRNVKKGHMRKGDLMFFYDRGGVYHVGIFTGWHHGHRWVLHAPRPGGHVHASRVWTRRWFGGTLRHHR